MIRGEKGGNYREKGEGFAGTIIKDTWTITLGLETGEGGGRAGVVGRAGGKGRKLYLNKNIKNVQKKKKISCPEMDK